MEERQGQIQLWPPRAIANKQQDQGEEQQKNQETDTVWLPALAQTAARSGGKGSPVRRTRTANQVRIKIVSPTNAQKPSRNVLSLFMSESPRTP